MKVQASLYQKRVSWTPEVRKMLMGVVVSRCSEQHTVRCEQPRAWCRARKGATLACGFDHSPCCPLLTTSLYLFHQSFWCIYLCSPC